MASKEQLHKQQLRKEFGAKFQQIITRRFPNWREATPAPSLTKDNHYLGIGSKTVDSWISSEQGIQRRRYYEVLERLKTGATPEDLNQLKQLTDLYEEWERIQEEKAPPPRPVTLYVIVGVIAVVGVLIALAFWASSQSAVERVTSAKDWAPQRTELNGLPMVKVPAGCFNMGTLTGRADEQPVTPLCFDKPYWIGETEVTIEQYGSLPDEECNTNKVALSGLVNCTEATCPRNCVTWEQANAFCQAKGLRLPTEAEWEFAGRSPDDWVYTWGNSPIYGYAIVRTNFSTNAIGGTMYPVGSKPQDISWVGAYDLAGSLREFTSTIYDTVTVNGKRQFPYPYSATDGREDLANTGTSTKVQTRDSDTTIRVVRGGSFDFGIEKATLTIRNTEYWDFLWNDYGFRCASDS
jgi:formylglycine-generating enzyme required for sulfatase activity